MSQPNPIRHVSDTALWVAIYRAMESDRRDAIFKDPYARRLGGERGEAIAARMGGKDASWPIVVRTAVMDEVIRRCIGQGAATVLNLAAGLDTRPYRLDLPRSLRWLHVDLPDMVEHFREKMAGEAPRCELEFIAADLRDGDARREVFTRAASRGPVLVVTEGLLIYLEAPQVAELARDLHDIAHARWWLSDLASPMLLRFLEKRWQKNVTAGNAPFQFGPAEGSAFFAPHGWREAEFHSTLVDAARLKRTMPFPWFWRMLSWLQPRRRRQAALRMSGVVLLEAGAEPSPPGREPGLPA